VPSVDTSLDLRIAIIMEMLEDVSRATDPNDAVAIFSQRMWRIRPIDRLISISQRELPPGKYKVTRRYKRADNGDRVPLGAEINPWRDWHSLPTHEGGFVGAVIARGEPQLFHDLDVTADPALADEIAGMGSCIAIPFMDQGKITNWTFHFRRDPKGYTLDDLEQQLLIGNTFGSMIKNLVSIDQINKLNAALRQQFEEVARIQQSLLPAKLPDIPGLSIATSYLTSEQAGGDYYDFFEIPGGTWGILIADVSGHGAGAATVMAMLHAILHTYPGMLDDPSSVMRFANRRLVASRMDGAFVTALFGIYDPARRTFSFARAGHPLPRVKDTVTGSVRALEGHGGLPLGITDEYDIQHEVVQLRQGETIVLYTDGITEEFDARRRMFGVEGLDDALRLCSGEPDCVVDTVHSALFKHTGRRTRADDQTLVVMKVV
jgi:sigma-B regulation protein RsbU (phosphoserine phosphatase)